MMIAHTLGVADLWRSGRSLRTCNNTTSQPEVSAAKAKRMPKMHVLSRSSSIPSFRAHRWKTKGLNVAHTRISRRTRAASGTAPCCPGRRTCPARSNRTNRSALLFCDRTLIIRSVPLPLLSTRLVNSRDEDRRTRRVRRSLTSGEGFSCGAVLKSSASRASRAFPLLCVRSSGWLAAAVATCFVRSFTMPISGEQEEIVVQNSISLSSTM
mmetsp:Transcript_44688/g.101048  ORF Transcript_44688/g.101048 Transcript_44688/m.101048 type:complete len:211 (-) Transcript_44688:2591-3223(-)